jgi:hypothetical protein
LKSIENGCSRASEGRTWEIEQERRGRSVQVLAVYKKSEALGGISRERERPDKRIEIEKYGKSNSEG